MMVLLNGRLHRNILFTCTALAERWITARCGSHLGQEIGLHPAPLVVPRFLGVGLATERPCNLASPGSGKIQQF